MNKKYLKFKAEYEDYLAIIEEDVPDFGWMLYIYKNNNDIFDSNQDSLKIC